LEGRFLTTNLMLTVFSLKNELNIYQNGYDGFIYVWWRKIKTNGRPGQVNLTKSFFFFNEDLYEEVKSKCNKTSFVPNTWYPCSTQESSICHLRSIRNFIRNLDRKVEVSRAEVATFLKLTLKWLWLAYVSQHSLSCRFLVRGHKRQSWAILRAERCSCHHCWGAGSPLISLAQGSSYLSLLGVSRSY
jgi:hypothetical protein